MNRWILVMAGVLVTLGSLQAAKTADDNWGLDGLTVAEWAAKRQAQEEQQKREAGGQFVNLREVKVKSDAVVYQENEPVNFYTGKPYDADLGYVFKFRNYNPEMQRWTAMDPSGFPDGANNYVFVSNIPIIALDPNGCYLVAICETYELTVNGRLSYWALSGAQLEEDLLELD